MEDQAKRVCRTADAATGVKRLRRPAKWGPDDTLESFARRIETRLRAGLKDSDAMERLICRLLTGKDPKVSVAIATKWVEWRYGRATEHVRIEGHVEHTVFNTEKLSDAQLAEAESLIESAYIGSDQG